LGRLSARLQTLPFKAKIEEFIGSSYSRWELLFLPIVFFIHYILIWLQSSRYGSTWFTGHHPSYHLNFYFTLFWISLSERASLYWSIFISLCFLHLVLPQNSYPQCFFLYRVENVEMAVAWWQAAAVDLEIRIESNTIV
jgi:hypothetical protein